MAEAKIDLEREQQASLARPRYRYSWAARCFFQSMDFVAGRKMTLPKAKALEILASIPYREWEISRYGVMTRRYRDLALVEQAGRILRWSREAQDNEYHHLLVIQEKMKADGLSDPWFLGKPMPWLMVWSYRMFARLVRCLSLRRAILFNAEFEDHAEHEYARLVADHPEWQDQPVDNPIVAEYCDAAHWADVFRRIGLDERDHRNRSFLYSGQSEHVVRYEGMPELEPPGLATGV